MTPQEITQALPIFEKFLGIHRQSYGAGMDKQYIWYTLDGTIKVFESKKKYGEFHSDWNWLMEVVEKIKTLGYSYTSDPWTLTIIEYLTGEEKVIINYEKDSDLSEIENLFCSIVELITWYNN